MRDAIRPPLYRNGSSTARPQSPACDKVLLDSRPRARANPRIMQFTPKRLAVRRSLPLLLALLVLACSGRGGPTGTSAGAPAGGSSGSAGSAGNLAISGAAQAGAGGAVLAGAGSAGALGAAGAGGSPNGAGGNAFAGASSAGAFNATYMVGADITSVQAAEAGGAT